MRVLRPGMARDICPPPLDPETRARLAGVSTATLCTAMFKHDFRAVFVQGPRRLTPGPAMVGPASTLRTIAAREDLDALAVSDDPANPQRAGVESCPDGAVFVIDGRGDARAASLGDILAARLMARGAAGIVTDGGYRDSADIAAMAIPAYHARPSAPTNLTRHHGVAMKEQVTCGEAAVFPGDVLVGDGDGVVCLPARRAAEVAVGALKMTAFADFVEQRVAAGASTFGRYPPTGPATADAFAGRRAAIWTLAASRAGAMRWPIRSTSAS